MDFTSLDSENISYFDLPFVLVMNYDGTSPGALGGTGPL